MRHLKSYNESDQSDSLESIIKTIFAEVLDVPPPPKSGFYSGSDKKGGIGVSLEVHGPMHLKPHDRHSSNTCRIYIFKPKNRQKSLQDELSEHQKYVELLEELEVGIKRLKDELPNVKVIYNDNAANDDFIYIDFLPE